MTGEIKSNEYNNGISNLPDIGSPILCFTKSQCVLKENEIWLEGALLKISSYPLLFKEYGYDYTPEDVEEPPEGYFYLKDWRNRVPWGSPDGTLGYLDATAPNITGSLNTSYQNLSSSDSSGALNQVSITYARGEYNRTKTDEYSAQIIFNAHNSNPIYQDGATLRPPSIKCRVKTRYR